MTCIKLCLFTGLLSLSLSHALPTQDGTNLKIHSFRDEGKLEQTLGVEAKRQTLNGLPKHVSLDVRRKRSVATTILSSFMTHFFKVIFQTLLPKLFGEITLNDLLEEVTTMKESLDSLAPDIQEILERIKAQEFRDDYEKFAAPLQVQFDRFARWESVLRDPRSQGLDDTQRHIMLHELDVFLTLLHHRLLGSDPYLGPSLPEKFLELLIHSNSKSHGFQPRESLRAEMRTFLEAVFDMQMIGFAIEKTLHVWGNESVSGGQDEEQLTQLNNTITVRLGKQQQHLQELFRDCPALHLEDEKWSPLTDLLNCTHGWQFGSVCTQVCDPRPGHRSLGYAPLQCLTHGKWSANLPTGESRVACTHPCWSWDKTDCACDYDSPLKLGYFLDGETLCQDARCEQKNSELGIVNKPPFIEMYKFFTCHAHGDSSRWGKCVPTFNPLDYNKHCPSKCEDIKNGTRREGVCAENNESCIPIQIASSASTGALGLIVVSLCVVIASSASMGVLGLIVVSLCVVLVVAGALITIIACLRCRRRGK